MLDEPGPLPDYIEYSLYFLFAVVLCSGAYWLRERWPRLTGTLILSAIALPILSFPVFYTVEVVPVFAEELLKIPTLVKLGSFMVGILVAGRYARWRIAKARQAAAKEEANQAERLWVEQLKAEQMREELGAETPLVHPAQPERYVPN